MSRRDLASLIPEDAYLDELIALRNAVDGRIRQFEQDVTVLNLDVVESTKLKAGATDVEVRETFRALAEYVGEIAKPRGLIAHQWSGDGLVCLFNEVETAVVAGLVIQAGLARFNLEKSKLEHDMQLRIGIHTGRLLYNSHRAIGETPGEVLDIAGHLQKDAGPGQLVISKSTHQQLETPKIKRRFVDAGLSRDDIPIMVCRSCCSVKNNNPGLPLEGPGQKRREITMQDAQKLTVETAEPKDSNLDCELFYFNYQYPGEYHSPWELHVKNLSESTVILINGHYSFRAALTEFLEQCPLKMELNTYLGSQKDIRLPISLDVASDATMLSPNDRTVSIQINYRFMNGDIQKTFKKNLIAR